MVKNFEHAVSEVTKCTVFRNGIEHYNTRIRKKSKIAV